MKTFLLCILLFVVISKAVSKKVTPTPTAPKTCTHETYLNATWGNKDVGLVAIGTCIPPYFTDIHFPQRLCEADGTWNDTVIKPCILSAPNCPAQSIYHSNWPVSTPPVTVTSTCFAGYYSDAPLVRYCGISGWNQYLNSGSGSCLACASSCATCNNGTSSNCLTCPLSFVLFNGQCLSSCPSGYVNISNVCTCDSSCTTCNGPTSSNCLSCSGALALLGSQCVSTCPTGTWTNGNVCSNCDSSCATCNGGSSSNCLSCSGALILYNSQCFSTCPSGTWMNGNTCSSCASSCTTCNGGSSSNCLSCSGALGLYNNRCVSNCPTGTWNDANVCTNCDSSCATCNGGTSSNCLSCSGALVLYNNQCVSTCPTGTWNDANVCSNCDSSCATCNGGTSSNCLSCSGALGLYNNQCASTCPTGTWNDANVCSSCDSSCATCNGGTSSNCLSCSGALVIYNNRCVSTCPTGTWNDANVCTNCDSSCATCNGGTSSNCLSCFGALILSNNQCRCSAESNVGNASWTAGAFNQTSFGTCLNGYSNDAHYPQRVCLASGWGTLVRPCFALSSPPQCLAQSFENALWSTTSATVTATGTCNTGFYGTPTRYCTTVGWNTYLSSGNCTSYCSAESNDGNAIWTAGTFNQTSFGICLPGYTNDNHYPQRDCLANGWGTVLRPCFASSSLPQCSAQSFENALWPTTNATVTATGTCNTGFYGTPTRYCSTLGWNTYLTTACTSYCPTQSNVGNASWTAGASNQTYIGTCLTGYSNDAHYPQRFCQANGWGTVVRPCFASNSPPQCLAQNFGNALWPTTNATVTAAVSCSTGYTGTVTRYCSAIGWNDYFTTGSCTKNS